MGLHGCRQCDIGDTLLDFTRGRIWCGMLGLRASCQRAEPTEPLFQHHHRHHCLAAYSTFESRVLAVQVSRPECCQIHAPELPESCLAGACDYKQNWLAIVVVVAGYPSLQHHCNRAGCYFRLYAPDLACKLHAHICTRGTTCAAVFIDDLSLNKTKRLFSVCRVRQNVASMHGVYFYFYS